MKENFDDQNGVKLEELSSESQEVVLCMHEQIEIGEYPNDDVLTETAEILLEVLEEN